MFWCLGWGGGGGGTRWHAPRLKATLYSSCSSGHDGASIVSVFLILPILRAGIVYVIIHLVFVLRVLPDFLQMFDRYLPFPPCRPLLIWIVQLFLFLPSGKKLFPVTFSPSTPDYPSTLSTNLTSFLSSISVSTIHLHSIR